MNQEKKSLTRNNAWWFFEHKLILSMHPRRDSFISVFRSDPIKDLNLISLVFCLVSTCCGVLIASLVNTEQLSCWIGDDACLFGDVLIVKDARSPDLQGKVFLGRFWGLDSPHIQEGLTPNHLKKAKLMFFYTRYPSSNLLKNFFPDVKVCHVSPDHASVISYTARPV